jgi:single-strand DNA-binding protein
MSFSQVQLLGNVGRDPEMTYAQSGTPVTKFSLAVTRKRGDNNETTWYNCTAFRGQAETINTHVTKGMQLFIQGDLSIRQYTSRDGKPAISIDVVVDKFTFAGGSKREATPATGQHGVMDPLGDLDDEAPF